MRALPVPATPLVGRKKELADLLRLVLREQHRLVTLTGGRGIGKTRLALEVAHVASESLETVVFTAGAVPRSPATGTLVVVDDAGPAEPAWLAGSGALLLCTSEGALGWSGEIEVPLRPLPPAPAVELLRQRLEERAPGLLLDYELAGRVCEGAGRVPLRIEAAARVLAERSRAAPAAAAAELLAGLLPQP